MSRIRATTKADAGGEFDRRARRYRNRARRASNIYFCGRVTVDSRTPDQIPVCVITRVCYGGAHLAVYFAIDRQDARGERNATAAVVVGKATGATATKNAVFSTAATSSSLPHLSPPRPSDCRRRRYQSRNDASRKISTLVTVSGRVTRPDRSRVSPHAIASRTSIVTSPPRGTLFNGEQSSISSMCESAQ